MTNSFIVIKGDYLNKSSQIFDAFDYNNLNQDKYFEDWQKFNSFLFENYFQLDSQDIAIRGIWSDNGWTVINDPEMVDTLDEETLSNLSEKLNAEIITFTIQTTSGSYGFTIYNENIRRLFFVSEAEVIYNLFEPVKEEAGLNINERIFVDDIFGLAKNFGIDLEGNNNTIYTVKYLGYSDETKQELEQFKQTQKPAGTEKPWWKIW